MAGRPTTKQSRTKVPLLSRAGETEMGRRLRTARDEMRQRVIESSLGRNLVLRRFGDKPATPGGWGELIKLGQQCQALTMAAGRSPAGDKARQRRRDAARLRVTGLLDEDAPLQRLLDAAVGDWLRLGERLPPSDHLRSPGRRAGRPLKEPVISGWASNRGWRARAVFGALLGSVRAVSDARREFLAAREGFVAANQRLVFHLTKRYEGRGVSREDLIQEGNLGLVRAAEQYDHRLGFRFSTYAVWWVRQAMARAVAEQSGDIRLPYVQYERVGKLSKATRNFRQAFGREPTAAELASRSDLSAKQVENTLGAGRTVASLQQPAGESGEQPLSNFMADTQTRSPCDQVERRQMIEQLDRLVDELPEREAGILRLRFGLGAAREHTLEEIGQLFELTRERIRQLEARALGRLRKPNQRRLLECFEASA